MASRSSETLLVFITLIVASVLLWFAVRHIAEGPTDHAAPQTHVDRSPPKAFSPPPAPVVVGSTPAPIDSTPELTEFLPLSTVEKLRQNRGVESYAQPREVATMNNFLWSVYPYLCILLFFIVPIIRMVTRPFSWSTRASGLFGRQLLGAASLMLHWGLTLVLIGHIVGLLGGVLGMQSAIGFFYWTGLFGGVLVLAGSVLALYRRYASPQVRAMSQPEDYVVHLFIISIVGLALYQVFVHRIFGIAFGASSWAASLWTFSPQPELMASSSLITKLHVLLALTFFGYFPFTKLVHFWTFPINYFVRPQLSMRTQRYRFQRRWEMAFRSDKSWLTYGLTLVAIIFLLSGMMLGKAQPTEASGIVLTASDSDVNHGPWLTGYPLYVSQCARCHGVTGRGDGAGAHSPTFSTIPRDLRAARFHFVSTDNGIASDDDLYRVISQGLSNTGMPAFADLTNNQILSLVDVLNDFRAGGSEPGRTIVVGDPPPATEASVSRGRTLFAEQCATCHGPTGQGDGEKKVYDYKDERIQPADLAAGKIKFSHTPEQMFIRITAGIPGGTGGGEVMTKFNRLPEADRWALVHYLRKEILPQQ